MSKKLVEFLNNHLSDLHILYTKIHNYHWNVEGSAFFTLHPALEGEYNKIAEQLDKIAERVLQLGERPLASLEDYLKHAKIKEAKSEGIKSEALVKSVLEDYEYIAKSLREGLKLAEEAGDKVSEDMFTGMLAGYEKTIWMLKAYSK